MSNLRSAIHIGPNLENLKESTTNLIDLVKTLNECNCLNDEIKLEAVRAYRFIAKSPDNVSISNCHVDIKEVKEESKET